MRTETTRTSYTTSAIRAVVTTLGIVGGIISMEHGFFEILQGNVPTQDLMINAIGPAQRLWQGAGEKAFTIIPDFLITGIFAVIFGTFGIIWSLAFVQKKYGGAGLLVLSLIQYLVGGGIAFFLIAIVNGIIAFRINRPLKFWRRLFPGALRRMLARSRLWLFLLIAFVVVFPIPIFVVIFGVPFLDAESTISLAWILGYGAMAFIALSIVSAFAHDVQKQIETHQIE